MPFSTFDLILCVCMLVALVGASSWLLFVGKRLDGIAQQKSSRWHHEYFHNGGLVKALMGRWNRQARLTDKSASCEKRIPD
ncbi:hypothetical protein [Sphingomonas sp. LR55]|uniref:hypothetical protein n=1 Tax=Sphingomonas sp. LR55 TaxID=3050231 RepID=UPI002FE19E8D